MRTPLHRRGIRWLSFGLALALIATGAAAFAFPAVAAMTCPQCLGFEPVGETLYVERDSAEELRTTAQETVQRARRLAKEFYGDLLGKPVILICITEACYSHLRGGGSRGMAVYDYGLVISPRGTNVTIVTHELSHIEFHTRIGAWRAYRGAVPAWFDEGLAAVVSKDARYLSPAGETDCCHEPAGGVLPATRREWIAAADNRVYAAAACRVDGWIRSHGGPAAIIDLTTRMADGADFSEVYGK